MNIFQSKIRKVNNQPIYVWVMIILLGVVSGANSKPTLTVSRIPGIEDTELENYLGKILKAPAESPYGRYYVVPHTGVVYTGDYDEWHMVKKNPDGSFTETELEYDEDYFTACYVAPYCHQHGHTLMVCSDDSDTLAFWDTTKFLNNTSLDDPQVLLETTTDFHGDYAIILPFISKDLSTVAIFGANTTGVVYSTKSRTKNGKPNNWGFGWTTPQTLVGEIFSTMDMYTDVETELAYCVSDMGNLRIIDINLIQPSTETQRLPILIESGAVLSAIQRSIKAKDRFLIGQVTGAISVRFISIREKEWFTLGSIPMAPGLKVGISGITAFQGQAAFFVVTTSTSDYYQMSSSSHLYLYNSALQFLITLHPGSMEYVDLTDQLELESDSFVVDVYSELPSELIILTDYDDTSYISMRKIEYKMEGCHNSCHICLETNSKKQCSSCSSNYAPEDSWVTKGGERGYCVPHKGIECNGEFINHCIECKEGEGETTECKKCHERYGLFENTLTGASTCLKCSDPKCLQCDDTSEPEQTCQKCKLGYFLNPINNKCGSGGFLLSWTLIFSLGIIFSFLK